MEGAARLGSKLKIGNKLKIFGTRFEYLFQAIRHISASKQFQARTGKGRQSIHTMTLIDEMGVAKVKKK